MKHLLNKHIIIDDSKRPKPEPNPKLLRQIKSRSIGFMTKEEDLARKAYLEEFKERERYNDAETVWH